MSVTREYKDRLFTFIFGREENREWTLSLYNAVNGSNYTDPEMIEFTTIKSVLYLGMHNDVSFLISNQMNLYEQQSTYNPNMPLRLLNYVVQLFSQYIDRNRHSVFSEKIIRLPVPKLVVFYNGIKHQPDETWLRLSDSFPADAQADVEVRVRMLNIHYHQNRKLLEVCRPLLEYSWLIDAIQANRMKMSSIDDAVNTALNGMPSTSILKSFLLTHRAEVVGMLMTEYDEVSTLNLLREEIRRDAIEEGLKEGKVLTTLEFLREGDISLQTAAKRLQMSESQVLELLNKNPQKQQ